MKKTAIVLAGVVLFVLCVTCGFLLQPPAPPPAPTVLPPQPHMPEAEFMGIRDALLADLRGGVVTEDEAIDRLDEAAQRLRPAQFEPALAQFEGTRREKVRQMIAKLVGDGPALEGPTYGP